MRISKAAVEKIYHRLFQIGIWLKGIDGLLELGGGILFLVVSPHMLNHYVVVLTQGELSEDPGDWLCHLLRHATVHLSVDSKLAGAAYLLGNGVVKVFLATGILRGKLWCYPAAIIIISLFVLAEAGRLFVHFSFPLLIGASVDTIIVLLILHEYRRIKARQTV